MMRKISCKILLISLLISGIFAMADDPPPVFVPLFKLVTGEQFSC